MKKFMKRFGAIFISALLVVMTLLPMSAFAEGTQTNVQTDGSVSVADAVAGDRYAFYKVLDATYSNNETPADNTDDKYNYTIDEQFRPFFATLTTDTNSPLTKYDTASEKRLQDRAAYNYIAALGNRTGGMSGTTQADNTKELFEFATKVKKFAKENNITADFTIEGTATQNNVPYGYYVMTPVNADADKSSVFAVDTITPNVTIQNKIYTPTVNKIVADKNSFTDADRKDSTTNTGYAHTAVAAYGDTVAFKIISETPDVRGYTDGYAFQVNDTLSQGLALVPGSLKVYVGNTEYVATEGVTAHTYKHSYENNVLKVWFDEAYRDFMADCYVQSGTNDAVYTKLPIVVTYLAKVDGAAENGDDAVTGVEGNSNKANVQFSNDPSTSAKLVTGTGTTDTSKDVDTRVYTGEFTFDKVNSDGKELADAVFELTAMNGQNIADLTITGAKVENNVQQATYDSATNKWTLKTNADNGASALKIAGLDEGTYRLTEITAPNGYQALNAPVVADIVVTKPAESAFAPGSSDASHAASSIAYTVTCDDSVGNVIEKTPGDANGRGDFNVVNFTQSILPKTGTAAIIGLMGAGAASLLGGFLMKGRKKDEEDAA